MLRNLAPHRRTRWTALAAIVIGALSLAACTAPQPDPSPTVRTPPPQYPPQPDFADTLAPAAFVPTDDTTSVSFSGSYADKGTKYDPSQIMNASQGGYVTMSNPRWFVDRLPQISEMGFEHIRIDHVLNDAYYRVVSRQADGTIAYDFSRLDAVVLSIVQQGFQPMLALSYTPSAFSKSAKAVPPLDEWAAAVTAVVSHYRDLGYTGWDWEVWNEPDHDGWTADQYNSVYAASAPAVKAVDPTARVGGATAAYLTSDGNISGQFISYAGAHPEVPVDFFSVHSYSSDNWDVVTAAKALLKQAGLDIPVLVTEWALNPSMTDGPGFGSDSNSSPTGAAYVARRLALAKDSGAERVFYFAPVEGLTYAAPYNGDLGLITVDGHRKSVGNVFEMYAGLGDRRIDLTAKGPGTGADTRAVGGFLSKRTDAADASLLLWNDTDTDASADVELKDLPYADTNVRITQRVVSSTQGNGFSDASTFVMPSYPSPNEHAPVVSDRVSEPSSEFSDNLTVPARGVLEVTFTPTDQEAGDQPVSVEPSAIDLAAAASGASVSASSSVERPADGWAAAAAIDGRRYSVDVDKSTVRGWSSQAHGAADAAESITVDLGQVRAVDSVSLWPYTTRLSASSGYPSAGEISGSADGATWTPLATLRDTGGAPVAGEQAYSFGVTEVRYIRVDATTLGPVTGQSGSYAFSLAEIEAYRLGVPDSGFEAGDLSTWQVAGKAALSPGLAHRGQQSVQLDSDGRVTTEIQGLRPDTTYTVGAYLKAGEGATASLTATLPASGPASATTETLTWSHRWVTFTTASDETSVTISVAHTGGDEPVWADDISISQVPAA